MNFYRVLSLQAILLFLPAQAFAEKTLIDLDSAPGNYSTWKVTELASNSVEFTATYAAVKEHEEWAPSYTIKLSDGGGNELHIFGSFQGSEDPRAESKLLRDGKEIDSPGPILQLKLGRPYHVRMSWSGTTTVIEIDGVKKSYEIGFAPTTIEAICSTGESLSSRTSLLASNKTPQACNRRLTIHWSGPYRHRGLCPPCPW